MTVTIRHCIPADGDALAALSALSFSHEWGERWPDRDVRAALSLPGVSGLVASVEDAQTLRQIGFLLSRQAADEAEILLLGVDPAYRRQAVGMTMLRTFLKEAQSMNIKGVFLEVRECNSCARSLYSKAGFEKAGERSNYYKSTDGRLANAYTLRQTL